MRIYGHRGATAVAPENTLASIAAAMHAGADGIECDVRLSAEGALVVLHDEGLARTTNGSGLVSEASLSSIRRLDAGAWFGPAFAGERVPLLEEVWEATNGRLILEIKGRWGTDEGRRTAGRLAEFLRGRDPAAAVVASFDVLALRLLRDETPHVTTGVLTTDAFDAASNIAAALEGGHEVCLLPAAVANSDAIDAAHAAGRRAFVWTVDDPARLLALEAAGADAVLCDDPGAALATLRR